MSDGLDPGSAGLGAFLAALVTGFFAWLRTRATAHGETQVADATVEKTRIIKQERVELRQMDQEQALIDKLSARVEMLEHRLDKAQAELRTERRRADQLALGLDAVAHEVQRDLPADDTGQHRLASVRASITSDPPPRGNPLPPDAGLRRPARGRDDES